METRHQKNSENQEKGGRPDRHGKQSHTSVEVPGKARRQSWPSQPKTLQDKEKDVCGSRRARYTQDQVRGEPERHSTTSQKNQKNRKGAWPWSSPPKTIKKIDRSRKSKR